MQFGAAMFDPSIPAPLQELVARELEPGKRIEWMGMPKAVFFTPAATAAFLFAIPWTAFSIFWTAGAAIGIMAGNDGPPEIALAFPLFGTPFILIGLGMLSAPLWARRSARRSVYVVTDRRAISFEGGRSTTIRSYPPEKLRDVFRKEKRDGSGDVIIARHAWRDGDGDRRNEEVGFLRVADARDVERRLKALAERAGKGEAIDGGD